jgi:hypothetical protein
MPHQSDLLSGAGLCASCRHARRIESAKGSDFIQCSLSRTDTSFPKYPALPVLHCRGYERPPDLDEVTAKHPK